MRATLIRTSKSIAESDAMMTDWYISMLKQKAIRAVDLAAENDSPAIIKVDALMILDLLRMLEDLRRRTP